MIRLIRIVFISSILLSTQIYAKDVEDIIENIQETYDNIKYLTASFKQIETFKLTGSESETEGKLYIKDGVKFRFETEDQVIVTDGDTIWSYNNLSKQLLIDHVRKDSKALVPRDMLFKYPKEYYSTLLGKEEIKKEVVYCVKLDPKENTQGYIKSMKLWVEEDSWNIIKIEITDLNSNLTTFEMTKIDTKSTLKDSFFAFESTPEMKVVDMR